MRHGIQNQLGKQELSENEWREFLEEELKSNPVFAKEWKSSEPEYQIARELAQARIDQNLTQKQLAERSGLGQSNISRIETGGASPTVSTLAQLASGLGKCLEIRLV